MRVLRLTGEVPPWMEAGQEVRLQMVASGWVGGGRAAELRPNDGATGVVPVGAVVADEDQEILSVSPGRR